MPIRKQFSLPKLPEPDLYYASTSVQTTEGSYGVLVTIEVFETFFIVRTSRYLPNTAAGVIRDHSANNFTTTSLYDGVLKSTLAKVISLLGEPSHVSEMAAYYSTNETSFDVYRAWLGIE